MRWLTLLILVCTLAVPAIDAQQQADLVRVDLEVASEPQLTLPMRQAGYFTFVVTDASQDDASRAGAPSTGYTAHSIDFEAEVADGSPAGWLLVRPIGYTAIAGDTREVRLKVTPTPSLEDRVIQINFTATIEGQFGSHSTSQIVRVETLGFSSLTVTGGSAGEPLQPREIRDTSVRVTNNAVFPRTFNMEVTDNEDCGLVIVPTPVFVVGPRESLEVPLTIQAPADKPYYIGMDCPMTVTVSDANDPGIVASTSVGSTVRGGYLDPTWVFWTLAVITAIIVLIIVAGRRKALIEEELLGKPQRPWTIPVERVYLHHLEARDPRAAYVVRHFLMEEEYQSALLWYKDFKQATRGSRAKERLVVRQEKAYNRFQRKWEKRIAQPMKEADRFEAKLQKQLDRQAKKQVRKDRRKWKKLVSKLEAAHEKRYEREMAAWEKAAKKAEKKGQSAPQKPVQAAPDLPPEPTLQPIALADHKWQKKADKARRKAIKRQGDLEVKFEKKDARRLRKVRRKVHKIARKIDDPEFASEHPLLAQEA